MICIDKNAKTPLYAQIYEQVKREILTGNRKEGELLPGIRTLSASLGIALNTVDKAYSQLALEGYIQAQKGSGFHVLDTLALPKRNRDGLPQAANAFPSKKIPQENYLYDFEYGSLFHSEFPASLWRKYTTDLLFSDHTEINQYQDKQGDLLLRRELKEYLYRARGVSCSEEQIILGCSLQACLDMICKLLPGGGREIAIEEPGYDGARDVFLNNQFKLHLLPATDQGVDISSLQDSSVHAVYVTPSHQFPFGSVLPIYKRQKLIDWAISSHAYIIEDDYDSDYRYDAAPIPALQSIDCHGRVIYIGTFSKALSPSLRVNYMILPEDLLSRYLILFSAYHPTVSWLSQRTIARFMQEGRYDRHVRRMSLIYKKRHDAFIQEITERMGGTVQVHGKGAGLHFMLEFPFEKTHDSLIKEAAAAGVKVYSPTPFWHQKEHCPQNLLFMGYSLLDENQIREAIALLQGAWFG